MSENTEEYNMKHKLPKGWSVKSNNKPNGWTKEYHKKSYAYGVKVVCISGQQYDIYVVSFRDDKYRKVHKGFRAQNAADKAWERVNDVNSLDDGTVSSLDELVKAMDDRVRSEGTNR